MSTSIIPSEICEACCSGCANLLQAICRVKDYEEDCVDNNRLEDVTYECDVRFSDIQEHMCKIVTGSTLREVADQDEVYYWHIIAINLIASTIINKCRTCFACLVENGHLRTTYAIDTEALEYDDNDKPQSIPLTHLVCKHFDVEIFHMYFSHLINAMNECLIRTKAQGYINEASEYIEEVFSYDCFVPRYFITTVQFPYGLMFDGNNPHIKSAIMEIMEPYGGLSLEELANYYGLTLVNAAFKYPEIVNRQERINKQIEWVRMKFMDIKGYVTGETVRKSIAALRHNMDEEYHHMPFDSSTLDLVYEDLEF